MGFLLLLFNAQLPFSPSPPSACGGSGGTLSSSIPKDFGQPHCHCFSLARSIVCLRTVWTIHQARIPLPLLRSSRKMRTSERSERLRERSKTLAGKINPASCAALAITALVCYNCKRGVGNEAPARISLPERRSLVLLQQLKVFAFSCEEDPATVLHPTVIAGIGVVTVCHSITSFLAHAA